MSEIKLNNVTPIEDIDDFEDLEKTQYDQRVNITNSSPGNRHIRNFKENIQPSYTEKTEYLSYFTHPNLSVLKGIQMSCSIPFIFKAVPHNNNFYIDGCVSNSFPIDCVCNYEKSIAIRLVDDCDFDSKIF
ncbi:patatin-like phospholipase family protein, partial [bacterium]|nr:patatin-like phospholipase family protein [bacterium]